MLKGKCNKCGEFFYGWSLQKPEEKVCDCGGEILLVEADTQMADNMERK